MSKVERLFEKKDPRVASLMNALEEVINERAAGIMPVATVIGVLEFLKADLIDSTN